MVYIFIVILLSGFISCSFNKKNDKYPDRLFEVEYSILGEELNIDPNKFSSPGRLILFEKKEYIIKQNYRGESFLEKIYYNLDSLVPLAKKGNGPNEYTNLHLMQQNDSDSFNGFDFSKSTFYTIHSNDSIINSQRLDNRTIAALNTQIGIISPCYYDNNRNSRYSIFSTTGKFIKSFGNFPDDNYDLPNTIKPIAYQGLMIYNPFNNRLVTTSTSGIIFEIYQLGNDTIFPILLLHEMFPNYKNSSNGNIVGVKYDRDNLFGYVDIYSTNKFIYLLYSGKKPYDYREEGMEAVRRSRHIHVFDWDGNPICKLATDVDVFNLCVSPDNQYMIALGWDDDYKLYRFELPSIGDN